MQGSQHNSWCNVEGARVRGAGERRVESSALLLLHDAAQRSQGPIWDTPLVLRDTPAIPDTLSSAASRLYRQRREAAVQAGARRMRSPKALTQSPAGTAGRDHAQWHFAALPLVARLGVRPCVCAPVPGLGALA